MLDAFFYSLFLATKDTVSVASDTSLGLIKAAREDRSKGLIRGPVSRARSHRATQFQARIANLLLLFWEIRR
jgi:hypothetical protein